MKEKEIRDFCLNALGPNIGEELAISLSNLSLNKTKYGLESFLYYNVIRGLTEELKKQGVAISSSMKLLIEQTAMVMVRIQRARLIESNSNLKLINLGKKQIEAYSEKVIFEDVHPIEKYIQGLEKQLIYLLKQLGLLPEQIVYREKIMIVKRMKKKLFEIERKNNSYEVEAIAESKEEI